MHADCTAGLSRPMPMGCLSRGTTIQDYRIKGVLGEGGFAFVYIADDVMLERQVAVKEYMPSAIALRTHDSLVQARSSAHQQTFDKGMRSFINEARLLAKFKHRALVEVLRFWEENGTAYMAMPYYRGRTLREMLRGDARAQGEPWLRGLIEPMLGGLRLMHAAECFHRDISTDNIIVLDDGNPVLLDFGAARRIVADPEQVATVILKPGFAPIEQYSEDQAAAPQGPWTDIYALCAVCYYAITRKMPSASVARIMRDPLIPLTALSLDGYSRGFLAAIDRGLAVRPEDRPQSVDAFRELLEAGTGEAADAPAQPTSPHALPLAGNGLRATSTSDFAPSGGRVPVGRSVFASTPNVRDSAGPALGEASAAGEAPVARLRLSAARLSVVKSRGGREGAATSRGRSQPATLPDAVAGPSGRAHAVSRPWRAFGATALAILLGAYYLVSTVASPPVAEARLAGAGEPAAHGTRAPEGSTAAASASQFEPRPAIPLPDPPTPVASMPQVADVASRTVVAVVPPPADTARPPPSVPVVANAPAKPAHGLLVVSARPWGRVRVDGKVVGIAPPARKLSLPAGRHEVVIEHASGAPKRFEIVIEEMKRLDVAHDFAAEAPGDTRAHESTQEAASGT